MGSVQQTQTAQASGHSAKYTRLSTLHFGEAFAPDGRGLAGVQPEWTKDKP